VPLSTEEETADLVVVGAGAAGLATAIFTKRNLPSLRVICLDGAARIGAKILVSGGSRCNVTNVDVTERDFWGGSSRLVRGVLRAFPSSKAVAFFADLGVRLHEEEDGKLFPDSNSSRDVLNALLTALRDAGVELRTGERVTAVTRDNGRFAVATAATRYRANAVVLATGGRSLPKTGSDGAGYGFARALGHGYVETTPALAPLILDDHRHAALAGVSHRVALIIRGEGAPPIELEGPLLWTHFGVSGPVVLNASRHWHRATLEERSVDVVLNICPGERLETLEAWLLDQVIARPRARIASLLAETLPAAVADAWVRQLDLEDVTAAHLTRESRRGLIHALLATPLQVRDSRGYNFAEVTAGGVPLDEIDPARMESRRCPGLFLVGEILDVDGRLGGFNFQWAWSSAWVAGRAIASGAPPAPRPPSPGSATRSTPRVRRK
jgi:predicted Rossmann fold flavoprotein